MAAQQTRAARTEQDKSHDLQLELHEKREHSTYESCLDYVRWANMGALSAQIRFLHKLIARKEIQIAKVK